jgi:oligopeptide/dipeptide ABC transporter ATP-binding protein
MSEALLQIRDLHTYFGTKEGVVKAVDGVSLELQEDSVLGLVGESGSGKTVTALSVLRIVPFPGNVVGGSIVYEGTDLLSLDEEEMRRIRGKEISLIFQDAGSALNPVMPIGAQVEEIMLEHTSMSESEARSLAVDLLAQTGIAEARRILDQYPFQLSGGMGQRVMMAIGVALEPRVLIADEPTSNLDVTMQAEMLQRLKQLQAGTGTAIMLITHDLGVIAQMADNVAVMYGGMIVEYTDTQTLFARPLHPYTWGLFQALPQLDSQAGSLTPMRGSAPTMLDPPDRCPFLERCPKAINRCRTGPKPKLEEVEPGHRIACYNPVVYAGN